MENNDRTQTTQAQALVFDVANAGSTAWYAALAPLGVMLCSAVVAYLCWYMLSDPSIVSKIIGSLLGLFFVGYVTYYYLMFFQSRKHSTSRVVMTDTYIESVTQEGTRRFMLSDIVFSMSYSSSTNLCMIVATNTEYMTMDCSCCYLFIKKGVLALKPFYAINKRLMTFNEKHINYVKSKKYRKKNPFEIAHFIFEIEYYTPRVQALLDRLRKEYRFR